MDSSCLSCSLPAGNSHPALTPCPPSTTTTGTRRSQISWQGNLRLAMQTVLYLPETPQEHCASLCTQLIQRKVFSGSPKCGYGHLLLPTPGATSASHKQKGTFQAVTLAWRVPGGSQPRVLMLPQINGIATRLSHSNTELGDTSFCPGLPCSKLT